MIDVKKIQRIFVSGKFDPVRQILIPKYDLDSKMALHFLRMAGITTQNIVWISPTMNLADIDRDYKLRNDVLIDVGQVKGPIEFGENCIVFDHHAADSIPADFCSTEQVAFYFNLSENKTVSYLNNMVHRLDCTPNENAIPFSQGWKYPVLLISKLNGKEIFSLAEKMDLEKPVTETELKDVQLWNSAQQKQKSINHILTELESGRKVKTVEGEPFIIVQKFLPSASFAAFEQGFHFSSFTLPTWAISFYHQSDSVDKIHGRIQEGLKIRETMILHNKLSSKYTLESFIRAVEGKN